MDGGVFRLFGGRKTRPRNPPSFAAEPRRTATMSKEPWLDALSDDWVSQPRSPSSPATPAFTSSFNNQSRRSSLRSSPSGPSRIPVPVRRPGQQTQQAQQTPGSENKKVPRLCYFMKPRDDGTPSRVKTPAKKKPKNNTKPSPGSGRRQSTGKVTRNSPLRSVSNASDQSTQSGTVQRRPGKGNGGDATPEWRRKLVRGENPGGGQCDLFAPMKLESVFKPPTPGSEDARRETFSFLNKTDSRWAFTNSASGQHQDTKGGKEDGRISEGQEPQHHEDPDNNSLPESPTESISKGRDARRASPSTSSNHEGSSNSDDRLRTVSGREELRNEGITPISLSRDDTFNAPSDVIKSALKKLNRHRDRMSMSHKERPGSRASDSGLLYQQSGVGDDLLPPDDLLEMTSQSLPKDLSMGTLDVAARRAFANLRRSSLRHRHLSPSSLPSPSTLATSKLRSSPPPGDPETPNPARPAVTLRPQPSDPKANRSNPAAMKPSGSPLKLFGDHDTFTNNKLLRRMSQFEETFADISEEDEPASPSEKPRRKGAKNSLPSLSSGDPHEQASRPGSQDATDPRMNRFGDGQLDDFGFPDKISSPQDLPQKVFEAPSPVPQESPEERHRSSRSSRQDGPGKSKTVDSTSEKRRSRDHQRMPLLKTAAGRRESTANQLRRRDISEVKRALNTPVRDSTPKRRRTLRRANSPPRDYEETLDMVTGSMENLSLLQRSLIRQGIKHEAEASEFNAPKTQQPKTPTPAQKRPSRGQWLSTSRGQSNQDLANKFDQSKGNDIPTNKAIPPAGVAGAMEESRRGSITTQDFLDEATKIMNIIRAKGRPKSGLTNVEESGEESQDNGGESYVDESTPEEFSRPPSREGVVTRNLRKPREQNPRVVSHLKKFEDKDESELLMGTSVTSLHLDKQRNATSSSRDARQGQGREIENGVERSPQNIRIRENPFVQRKRKHSSRSTDGESNPHNATTVHTQASSNNSSTGRSVPTGSSHGSNAKGVISSDMISHLIPEQVNGMTYDRSNHMWVKKSAEESPDKQRGDDSEEDPFQGIPDLSVDELQELMRVQELTSPEKTKDTRSAERESNGANIQSKAGKSEGKSFDFRPQPKDGEPSIPDTSSIQSRSTHFTSSVPKPETRATSWGTGELSVKPVRRSDRSGNEQRSKEPAHEVNLHEGRMSAAPQRQDASARQPRAVTISFSSPLVSHVAYAENDSPAGSDQGSSSHSREKGVKPEPIARNHDEPHPKVQSRHKTTVRSPSPRTSLDGRPFIRSSISRIDEQNEETVNEQSLVRRDDGEPESDQPEQPLLHPPSGHDASYSFHLSPLPDFTVNQIDDPLQLEVSYVALRTHPTSLREVHGTFTLAVEDLVKHITDVEPYEPYWEHLRRLDLRRKGLITIHRLNDFCPRLEELDVSYNDIGQLSGAPSTLRHLRIQRNCISGLTAWGHLKNLQYLDVSGNDLDNLDGFSGLIHLRELRANNNKIRNLDGILDLDGLLSLKLRGNALTEVDFEGSEL